MTEETGWTPVGEQGEEPIVAPEDVEVTSSGGITLPPLRNWSNPDATDDDSS